jgi:hypothetical protein
MCCQCRMRCTLVLREPRQPASCRASPWRGRRQKDSDAVTHRSSFKSIPARPPDPAQSIRLPVRVGPTLTRGNRRRHLAEPWPTRRLPCAGRAPPRQPPKLEWATQGYAATPLPVRRRRRLPIPQYGPSSSISVPGSWPGYSWSDRGQGSRGVWSVGAEQSRPVRT